MRVTDEMRARGATTEQILEVLYRRQSFWERAWSWCYWGVALLATKMTGRLYPKWLRNGLEKERD